MIVVYHKNNTVVEVWGNGEIIGFPPQSIANTLFTVAAKFSDNLVIWCRDDLKQHLNLSGFQNIFHHRKIMASYNLSASSFLGDAIGYVEGSPFIKINKKVSYPTWQMSSDVGGVHASVLLALKNEVQKDESFDYFLHSIAKLSMLNGLLCYSEPKLLKESPSDLKKCTNDHFVLFQFVQQHYKTRWLFLLFLNLFLYERKLPVMPLALSLFYKKRKLNVTSLSEINVESTKKVVDSGTIDVIIPTIGRKLYLYDVLKDLSKQTHLPENVIIVEQNPVEGSISELDYVRTEVWPFAIKHTFTHQAGACNARNVALSQVTSEWVFLNDDDNRFDENLLKNILVNLKRFGIKSLSACYLQSGEVNLNKFVYQAAFFGSGNSFLHSSLLTEVKFNMKFEFGYGEDTDFGMQLRNFGVDVLYFPHLEILHLKAPMGGFRTKPVLAWYQDLILPKPSPTIMLYKLLHLKKEQINGYKTILFFKFYKAQSINNPIRYFINFTKQWERSIYWAKQLKN